MVSWEPRFVDAAASGDLGFTVGDATFELPASSVLHQVPHRLAADE
jgi:hypothetical protein